MACIGVGPAIVCTTGPTKEIHREGLGDRWCFGCRRKVEFVYIVTDVVAEMSYYDPWPSVECVPSRHHDGDLFPGRYREWE